MDLLELLAWDTTTNALVVPNRPPVPQEKARHPSGTIKEWNPPIVIVEPDLPDVFTTNNESVTINGNPTAAFKSLYFGANGDSANMIFNIVNDQGALQTQLDSSSLGYPPILSLPVLKFANGDDDNTIVDEVYFATTLVNGVITVAGSFPASGNWKILTTRINAALGEIGADWTIEKDDITFRISS